MDNIPLKLFQGITACATFLHWKDSSLKSIVTSRFSWGNCGINLGLRDRFLMGANGCLVLPPNVCFFILILKLKCFSTPRTSSPMPRALGGSLFLFSLVCWGYLDAAVFYLKALPGKTDPSKTFPHRVLSLVGALETRPSFSGLPQALGVLRAFQQRDFKRRAWLFPQVLVDLHFPSVPSPYK